jgi:cyclopropane-fatty-acyl-phospholipid synthase
MFNVHATARRLLLSHWNRSLKDATIVIHDDNGTEAVGVKLGTPGADVVELQVKDPRFFTRTLSLGSLGLGEAYMDCDFTAPVGGVDGLMTVLVRNKLKHKTRVDPIFALKYAGILAFNFFRSPASNVQAHYDLGDDLFESFLDPYMQYTCAYARTPDDDLGTMQLNKMDRICRKLRLKEGESLVDLGCGWGGLLVYAAKHYGIRGRGFTNSPAMASGANRRAAEAGVADRITFTCGDFTEVTGQYDKVVSIGMMEHLRQRQYPLMFEVIARTLKPGGLALVHTCACTIDRNRHDPFIQKYIFPGSNWPRLAQIVENTERQKLAVIDVENLARHYLLTVKHWKENFETNRHKLNPQKYDERFVRMWQFFFAWCVAATSASEGALFQVLLANDFAMHHPYQRV